MTTQPPRVAVIGGYFSANMGGAAMTQVVVDHAQARGAAVTVLTLYPRGDRSVAPPDLDLVPWRPQDILVSLPFALLTALLRLLRLPHGFLLRTQGLRSLSRADLVVDVAGISFADGRDVATLGYNVLMTGIPVLLGTPVVKASQALGPFTGLNRVAARLVLPRLRMVVARGAATASHLRDLGLAHWTEAADLAFALETDAAAEARAAVALDRAAGDAPFVVVVPSSVVKAYCDQHGIDYIREMGALVRGISTELEHRVLVLPHSLHPSGREGRMHDMTVCRDVVAAAGEGHGALVEDALGPAGLRAVIGRAEALVTSRFHAMISGLASGTPTLVVGWSHKYAEVLDEFGLQEWAVDYSHLDGATMTARTGQLLAGADAVRDAIRVGLPDVVASARRNLEAIDAALPADTRDL
jgi:colanic acid/amylovoran biosynthesis protein